MSNLNTQHLIDLPSYLKGSRDNREWGWYEVINVGLDGNEEFCEKEIGILPKQALSLQRHHGRREIWSVIKGQLSVIVNGKYQILNVGEEIIIPHKAAHCMINMTNDPVVVYEKQVGFCREDDNDRLYDFNGRETLPVDALDHDAISSIEIYKKVMHSLKTGTPLWYKDDVSNEN